MQIYLTSSTWVQFWYAWTIIFALIAFFILPKAVRYELHKWRIKSDYRFYIKEEQYWRDLKKGSTHPRRRSDYQKLQGLNKEEFELFLLSIWSQSAFWYDWRVSNYWMNRQNRKFEILENESPSPTGEKADKVIYF